MRGHVFLWSYIVLIVVGFGALSVSIDVVNAEGVHDVKLSSISGSYESAVTFHLQEGSAATQHGLVLPWSAAIRGAAVPVVEGAIAANFIHEADGTHKANASLSMAGQSFRAALFLRRPHRSSEDPFKLVHSSAVSDKSVAGVISWAGTFGGQLQYVDHVPMRRGFGPLASVRLELQRPAISFSLVQYGSDRVHHRFAVVDGRTSWGGRPLTWGAASLTGVEVVDGPGAGLVVHRSVGDGAAFVRNEWRIGSHAGWVRLHATGSEFRSLVADSYPFSRGKFGVEGRWQWRLPTGTLLSTYGQRLQPLRTPSGRTDPAADYAVEFGVSRMPKGVWGWKVDADGKTNNGSLHTLRVEATITDSAREYELVTGPQWRNGRVQWRHRAQWDPGPWRLRLLVDGGFAGWRAEWRVLDVDGWGWTVVHKRRAGANPASASAWTHVEVQRRVPGFGQLWARFMEPDLGRIDVGWTRAQTAAVGLTMSF